MDFDQRAKDLGIDIPDFSQTPYYGMTYGSMKPHHQVGSLLFLSGHIPEYPDGSLLYPGRLGQDVTIEQGYEAARLTAINCLAGIRFALGTLNRVKCIVRTLNFVVCTTDFYDVNRVSSGATDLFVELFGEERGLGGRATIGVTTLSRNNCFENWATIEVEG